jgi:mRNA-degrading endonuclease RelE of RelBE toxin-antitoxin system
LTLPVIDRLEFTPYAKRQLEKLPRDLQKRTAEKLEFFLKSDHPLNYAKPLVNLPPATNALAGWPPKK